MTPDTQRASLRDRILSGPVIVGDGATGSGLQQRGLPVGTAPERWTFDRPDDVRQLASDHVDAGAEFVLTNTFGANAIRWGDSAQNESVEEANMRAVYLASAGVDGRGYVVGSVGPTGATDEGLGERYRQVYAEQVNALIGVGVDGICVETVCSSAEGLAAVAAVREVSDVPVILSFTLRRGSRLETLSGEVFAEIVLRAADSNVDVVGVNCVGYDLAREAVHLIQEISELPVAVRPNAGTPERGIDGLRYPEQETELADKVASLVSGRVCIVGGCCGTGPQYVSALREAVRKRVLPEGRSEGHR